MDALKTIGAMAKGKLTAEDKQKAEDLKREQEKRNKPKAVGDAVATAASPFSYLLSMTKKKKVK